MALAARTLRNVLIAAALFAVLLVVVFVVLTRSDFGVEQTGRFALDRLRQSVNGEVEVQRITSRGLLRGVTLHGLSIVDPDGRPFVRADSARLAYHLRTLLGGDLAFDRLTLYRPEIHLERLPGGDEWNFERIFPGDTIAADTLPRDDLILIDDVTIHDGLVVVRLPWEPDGPVAPADTSRMILEQVPGGTARTIRFEDVNARIPRIAWQTPHEEGKLVQVGGLSARAFIFDTPAEIRSLQGTLTIRDSLYTFDAPRVRLPNTQLSVAGRVILDDDGNHYDVEAQSGDAAFSDFQWLYPRMPTEGGGALRLRIQTQDSGGVLWLARDARLRTGGTQVAGSFGVVTGDTLYFTNVDLRASPLDLELLQTLLPVDLELEGLLVGTVEVEGPISSLSTRGDLRYRRPMNGGVTESDVRWAGVVRALPPRAVSGFDAELRRVDLEQLSAMLPWLAMDGILDGRVRADGVVSDGLRLTGAVGLEHDGVRSSLRGAGLVALNGGRSALDLRFEAEPVSLELLARRFPGLGRLTGDARGPLTITGPLDDLHFDADLVTPAGGISFAGRLGLAGPEPSYRGHGEVTDFRLDRVVGGLTETIITGRFDVDGQGGGPAALSGSLDLELTEGRVGGVSFHEGVVRAAASNGLLRIDSLFMATEIGVVGAAGALGIAPGRIGELDFTISADSVALLEPLLFPELPLMDSLAVPVPRLGGRLAARGTIRGGLADHPGVRVAVHAEATDALYDRVRAAFASVDIDWERGGDLSLAGTADTLTIGHRTLLQTRLGGSWKDPEGHVVLHARGPAGQRFDLEGTVARTPTGGKFFLRSVELESRDGVWALADSVHGSFGRGGVALEPLLLTRRGDGAQIRLAGSLPWREPDETGSREAGFVAEIADVRIGELLRLAQSDTLLDGLLSGRLSVSGTALDPVVDGHIVGRSIRVGEALLDSARAAVSYRDRLLRSEVRGWRGSSDLLHGEAEVPLDLALMDRAERRLDRPVRAQLRADSVPAALVSFLTPGFHDLSGQAHAVFTVAGTTLDPTWQGELRVEGGGGFFEHSGVHYRDVDAVARVSEDAVMRIDGRFRTENGSGQIRGSLDLTDPRDPGFDLEVEARRLDVTRRRDVTAIADGRAHLGGRYTRPVVSGRLQVLRGEMNLAEILRQYQIVQLDPWLYEVFDTASLGYRPPPDNPFVRNLVVSNATVSVARDFWLRSPELNVEVAGALAIVYDPPPDLRRSSDDLRLTGSLQALRGTYELQVVQGVAGRRFDIRAGTIEFAGTPGINPDLDIEGQYRVRRRQGDPIDVLAVVSGRLESPRVRFASDSDPPISEADLASYLLFGRSTLELTHAESDIVSRGLGFMRPALSGTLSAQLQNVAASLGFPVDYFALSVPEGLGEYGQNLDDDGWAGVFQDTQVDVGFYAWRELFLVGSVRFGSKYGLLNRWGGRAEYRFLPTWTGEFFVEDRFARLPSFGLEEIENRTVVGISLFREWSY